MNTAYKKLPINPDAPGISLSGIKGRIKQASSAQGIWLPLTALMGFAALVSLFLLSRQSLRLDEAQSLWQSSRSVPSILNIIAKDVHVPLYAILLHAWQFLFGNNVSTVRVFSLAFFLPTIPLVYFLGNKAFNHKIAMFSTLLFAVSPFINWYGNEIRMYSLLTFLTVANQYMYVGIFRHSKTEHKNIGRYWFGYAATALLGIYTHYFFWLSLATQGVFYLFYKGYFEKKSFRNFTIIAAGLVLSIVPWLLYVKSVGQAANATPLLVRPTAINFFNTFSQFLFGFQDDHLNTIIVSLWPLTVLLLFLSLRKHQKIPPMTVYFFLSAIFPVVTALAVSILVKPLFLTRYLILATPSLFIFISWFLTTYPKNIARLLKTAIVAAMLVMLFNQVHSASSPVKENYEQAVEYVNGKATIRDIIAISAPFTVYPFEYYYTGPAAITTLPIWDRYKAGPIPAFSEQNLPSEVEQIKADHEKVYLLLSYDQGFEATVKNYFDTHYERLEEKNFSQGLNLYVYKLRYDDAGIESVINAAHKTSVPENSVSR